MSYLEKIFLFQKQLINKFLSEQQEDGSWRFPCENGPHTDVYTIIILRVLNMPEEKLIIRLAKRLLSLQERDGTWKLHSDEEDGNLSATVEAYTGLLFSGVVSKNDERMKRAEEFIKRKGGLKKTHNSTKFMLALNQLYPWPVIFPIPLTLLILPRHFPINFNQLTSYVKIHFAAILIAAYKRVTVKTEWTPDLSHLILEESVLKRLKNQVRGKIPLLKRVKDIIFFKKIKTEALKKAESYILERIEDDGTAGSYTSATSISIFSLIALGYGTDSPLIKNAAAGIINNSVEIADNLHIQNAPSGIWDTSLIACALNKSECRCPEVKKAVRNASSYLVKRQQNTGAWGFSESNSWHPDVDDTQAALRTVQVEAAVDPEQRNAFNKGFNWLLRMQNKDGGWGSFENNRGNSLVKHLPIENIKDTAVDPSSADLTGRVLEFLGDVMNMNQGHPVIDSAVKWLAENQERDGSWYGRWGTCYIYGTWAAVTGLRAAGLPADFPPLLKAERWLISIQKEDGGWGESCYSDQKKYFQPLPFSTPAQTAWALDALIAINGKTTESIDKGMRFLAEEKGITGYPTGGGLPGSFYLNYHSYDLVWPLIAVNHYIKKYKTEYNSN